MHNGNVGTGFGLEFYIFFMKDPMTLKLQAPWEEVKERLKENDINLTDADLEFEPGKEEEFLQRLEKLMNKPRHQIIAYIESISSNEDKAG